MSCQIRPCRIMVRPSSDHHINVGGDPAVGYIPPRQVRRVRSMHVNVRLREAPGCLPCTIYKLPDGPASPWLHVSVPLPRPVPFSVLVHLPAAPLPPASLDSPTPPRGAWLGLAWLSLMGQAIACSCACLLNEEDKPDKRAPTSTYLPR